MKQSTNLFWVLAFAVIFAACSDSDDTKPDPDPDPDPAKRILVTKIELQVNNQKVPYMEFTYDDNDLLTAAVKKNYEDGVLVSTESFTLTRNGKNNAVADASFVLATAPDNQVHNKFGFVYDENGQITEKIRYASDGTTKSESQTYKWAYGQITEVNMDALSNKANIYEIKYDDKGIPQPLSISALVKGEYDRYNYNTETYTPTINESKLTNFFSHIPLEVTLLFLAQYPGDLMRSQISNEITSFDYKYSEKTYPNENYEDLDILGEKDKLNNYKYTYVYEDNGLPSEVTQTLTTTTKFKDYLNPDEDFEEDNVITVMKLYPTYLVKEMK
ncbi:hypothetical protein [Prevotella sp. 10(H)]|uniref:hypothetical protein n=1 Tax=Prevotella sp. 10(H) TaxID=1158294 RepID=UPI0004A70C5A|nr:hypothetical protein [Prevotella sp. 10(H)]